MSAPIYLVTYADGSQLLASPPPEERDGEVWIRLRYDDAANIEQVTPGRAA